MKTYLITLSLSFVLIRATASTFTVTANPLWTATGISLGTGNNVSITATGIWSSSFVYRNFGPGGIYDPADAWDTFLNTGDNIHGQLLAYVGPDPYQGEWGNASFFPQATGYWDIGSSGSFTAPVSGQLWLGMNDGAVSEGISDNSGSVVASVQVVPEPSTGVLFTTGFCLLGLAFRSRSRSAVLR
jgi:hypothetical protein